MHDINNIRTSPRLARVKFLFERYWVAADPAECWEWRGKSFSAEGYGRFGANLEPFKQTKFIASRLAYVLYVGPIPEGLLVLHECDNPACVNPKHLFLGTHVDNSRDMIAKGRANPTEPWISNKLRERIRQDSLSDVKAAKKYGASRTAIIHIRGRR